MPRNGSGTYAAPASSWNPAIAPAAATPADWNALLADLGAAVTQSISRDGQSPATADIPMGGFKLTGLAAAIANGDAARFEQLPSATNPLPIGSGGTGATTAIAARAALGVRIIPTSGVTLYVATTGSDSNDGLTIGTPFLTIQKAYDTFYKTYDMAGFTPTIQLADGTYTSGLNAVRPVLGVPSLGVIINGNSGTPANVIVSTTSSNAIAASQQAVITTQNMELRTTTSGTCLFSSITGVVTVGTGVRFGACAGNHMYGTAGGIVSITASYSVVGGATGSHLVTDSVSQIRYGSGITATLTGTPAFNIFAQSSSLSLIFAQGVTYTGAATGTRYTVTENGVINTNGGGANYFPGSVAGPVPTSGGQYI